MHTAKMTKLVLSGLCLLLASTSVSAQDTEVPFDEAALEDDDSMYPNNLGPLDSGSTVADIAAESENANGTAEGEITIYRDASGVKVYSGPNKVEVIPTGSDGWVGSYTVESSRILFHPAGRAELECAAQAASGWYGPCKLPNVS